MKVKVKVKETGKIKALDYIDLEWEYDKEEKIYIATAAEVEFWEKYFKNLASDTNDLWELLGDLIKRYGKYIAEAITEATPYDFESTDIEGEHSRKQAYIANIRQKYL